MAKQKRRKASLHSAGKVQEQDILARARALAEDPHLAEPICEGGCVFFSPSAAARRGIAKAHRARDDETKLAKLAGGSGNGLAVAYAATLLVAKSEKVPYVGEIRLDGITAPYVARGKAKPLFLAGLQNHHDRRLRLLAVAPWVKKRGMHFYSAERGIVCTGRRSAPPRDFVEEEMDTLDLVPKDGANDSFSCGHAGRDTVVLKWRDAGDITVERCVECCATSDVPTLHSIVRHMAVPEATHGFDVGARLAPLEPPIDIEVQLPDATQRAYAAGQIGDAQLLEAARAARVDALKRLDRRVFVAGDRSFEHADAFVRALSPTPGEERALRAALAAQEGPVVLDKATSARALAELWPRHGRAMLEAAAGDAQVAARLHRERVTTEDATDLIRRAEREGSHKSALGALPTYRNLPPQAAVADQLARAFRTGGHEAAVRAALERAGGARTKGVALAFLEALGATKGQEWRFAQTDRDAAASIGPAVERLLRGPAERYHEALREASLRAGETVSFEPVA